ncbi:MAG TPA: cupredoxin domain-containing protein [Candidatus Dormibacteraeota bacterium]|nr:cupredoxin domain-containing protein [Candidatus Dormibacteraeota bacterium]
MRAVAVALATVAVLAACGGSGGSQPAGSTKVTLSEFKFDPSSLTVTHGKVVFWLVNSGNVAHDLAIRDSSGNRIAASELVSAGDSMEFDVSDLAAGSYTIFCTQQGHEASGMKGTLTVT